MIDEDEELNELRARATRRALETGLEMLDNPNTPATARASIVRALLADAVQRRGEVDEQVEPYMMTGTQLAALTRKIYEKHVGAIDAIEAEILEPMPSKPGVFD